MTNAERLINDLHRAFDYTGDNNPDLIGDVSFPLEDVLEELEVAKAYNFLCAYIARNETMINSNMED